MIPYVYFLLGDGLKSYFEWINDVLRSKHQKNDVEKKLFLPEVYGNFEINILLTRSVWKFRNQDLPTKNVIYSLPQAPFGKINVQKNMKNMRFS